MRKQSYAKRLLQVAFIMMCATHLSAQVTPQMLGKQHALVQFDGAGQPWLLLPVEEREGNAHLRIVQDNNVVKEFNCRLAVDKVDHLVPLSLTQLRDKAWSLDITFADNPRATGAVSDFVCWQKMTMAPAFEVKNTENYRPLYHHAPLYGWMNDPNGMFYKDGVWNLYYQFNPFGSQWENMTWGHATSKDLVTWNYEGTPIEPDAWGTIFSGSAVVDANNTAGWGKGAVVAMYTSAGKTQTQSMAYSTDGGKTFSKYAENPVLTSDVPDFRDPHVFWNKEAGFWNVILAAGQEMRIYSSKDLKNWTFESAFGTGYGAHGGVWECPDLMPLKVRGTDETKWLLICNLNPGGPFGGSATQYFVGSFDGHQFKCETAPEVTRWMDYGKDHYATVTFDNAPDGRRVALAWMSNWQYANLVPTQQFRSVNSIPRDLDLFDYNGQTYCGVKPSPELLALRGKKSKKLSPACEMVVQVKGSATIELSNEKGEKVNIIYNEAEHTLAFDRRQSGKTDFNPAFAAITTAPVPGRIRTLRVFIDKCSVEVFDAEGRAVLTNLVFPTSPYNKVKTKGRTSYVVYDYTSKVTPFSQQTLHIR